jgi:hypothetical protein
VGGFVTGSVWGLVLFQHKIIILCQHLSNHTGGTLVFVVASHIWHWVQSQFTRRFCQNQPHRRTTQVSCLCDEGVFTKLSQTITAYLGFLAAGAFL